MITSLSWLKNHLATNANLNQVVERLTEIGLEVENIKSANDNLDNFIICKIIKSQKHPNADKLKICDVDTSTVANFFGGFAATIAPDIRVIVCTNATYCVIKSSGVADLTQSS